MNSKVKKRKNTKETGNQHSRRLETAKTETTEIKITLGYTEAEKTKNTEGTRISLLSPFII